MRNSSSLDWLRFMHTPNDYRVSQRTRGIFPRMRYTSILTFHQTITLVCLSKPAEVRALHRFACRHKQKLQQQVCELREPVSIQNGSTESSRKGITCPHRIGNRNSRRLLERDNTRGKHITAINSASQNQHLQVVFCQQNPTFIL